MSKKNKEYVIIGVIVSVLLIGYLSFNYFTNKNSKKNSLETQLVEVRYKDDEIMTFDIDENADYTIDVDLGHMHIQVKDGQYRVHDVDCPDKICEKVGWVSKGSPTLIVCLPNNIVILQV